MPSPPLPGRTVVIHTRRTLTPDDRRVFGLNRSAVTITDVWLELDVMAGWRAALRLVPFRGEPVVSEVRVFPADEWPGRQPGEWRAAVLGLQARDAKPAAHAGAGARFMGLRAGMPAELLRKVRFSEVQRHARPFVAALARLIRPGPKAGQVTLTLSPDGLGAELAALSWRRASFRASNRSQPPAKRIGGAWPDRLYAEIARSYAAALERGSRRPIADVARRRTLSAAQVRDAIHTARQRGLLTAATKQGRAEGRLTPAARALLTRVAHRKRRKAK